MLSRGECVNGFGKQCGKVTEERVRGSGCPAGRASSFPTAFIAFARAPLPDRYRLSFGPQGLAWIMEHIQSYVILQPFWSHWVTVHASIPWIHVYRQSVSNFKIEETTFRSLLKTQTLYSSPAVCLERNIDICIFKSPSRWSFCWWLVNHLITITGQLWCKCTFSGVNLMLFPPMER